MFWPIKLTQSWHSDELAGQGKKESLDLLGKSFDSIPLRTLKQNENHIAIQTSESGSLIARHRGFFTTPSAQSVPTENRESSSESETPKLVLKYHDGKPDGKKSIAGSGEMIQFSRPSDSQKLKGIRLHAARYGTFQAPIEDVEISIVSEDEKPGQVSEGIQSLPPVLMSRRRAFFPRDRTRKGVAILHSFHARAIGGVL